MQQKEKYGSGKKAVFNDEGDGDVSMSAGPGWME